MSMARVALQLVRSMLGPRAWHLEMARLTMRGLPVARRVLGEMAGIRDKLRSIDSGVPLKVWTHQLG
jgi:hypothetical protein